MSENIKKGPLIKKKTKPSTLERPRPVVISNQNDFKFTNDKQLFPESTKNTNVNEKKIEPTASVAEKKSVIPTPEPKTKAPRKVKSVVGKNNNVKSIKVPHDLHIQIGVLGKFMDENKTYAIISELVEYYTKNELTDRQQKQFDYMTEFFNEQDE
ncbi:hypothetical protein [Planomicrobium okeanokoites]|uniref:hypothetical protein n=1 Tax=Planomicrobium okeanokoites TaxID=244 RepID=UPI0024937138|nr:hypothetical protein [Planomicrobium okeanokoites]